MSPPGARPRDAEAQSPGSSHPGRRRPDAGPYIHASSCPTPPQRRYQVRFINDNDKQKYAERPVVLALREGGVPKLVLAHSDVRHNTMGLPTTPDFATSTAPSS